MTIFYMNQGSFVSNTWNYLKVKLVTFVEGDPKAPFLIATTTKVLGGTTPFPGLLYFILDPYLILVSVKKEGIKYYFLSLWYDLTRDWTQVSQAICKHSNHHANIWSWNYLTVC